jgi:hypothetical protein
MCFCESGDEAQTRVRHRQRRGTGREKAQAEKRHRQRKGTGREEAQAGMGYTRDITGFIKREKYRSFETAGRTKKGAQWTES